MSLRSVTQPLNNPLLGTVGRPLSPPAAAPTRTRRRHRRAAAAAAARPAQPAALRPQAPLSAAREAPAGRSAAGHRPSLWSVLTGEERAFFAKAAASGPLTYSRISAGVRLAPRGSPVPPAASGLLGGRLDVRG
jgi:hypothetical protein